MLSWDSTIPIRTNIQYETTRPQVSDVPFSAVKIDGIPFKMNHVEDDQCKTIRVIPTKQTNVLSELSNKTKNISEFLDSFGWNQHFEEVNNVCISSDQQWIVSASDDKTIKVWSIETEKCIQTFSGHTNRVTSVCISSDKQWIVSGSSDKTIKVWSIETGECIQTFSGHDSYVMTVCISSDQHWVVSGSDDKTIKIWSMETEKCIQTFAGHNQRVTSVCISSDKQWIVSGSSDKTIKRWSIETGECIQTLSGHHYGVSGVCISSDQQLIVSASDDKTIKVWSIESGKCIQTFSGHNSIIRGICMSSDQQLIVSASDDKTIKVWSIESGKCIQTFSGHAFWVRTVCISSDQKWIVSGSKDKTIKIWSIETGKCIQTFCGYNDWVNSFGISADQKWIVTGSADKTTKIWSTSAGQYKKAFEDSIGIQTVMFTSDKTKLLHRADDGTTEIWDTDIWNCVCTCEEQFDTIKQASMSHCKKYLITAPKTQNVLKVWSIETELSELWLALPMHPKASYGYSDSCFNIYQLQNNFIILKIQNEYSIYEPQNKEGTKYEIVTLMRALPNDGAMKHQDVDDISDELTFSHISSKLFWLVLSNDVTTLNNTLSKFQKKYSSASFKQILSHKYECIVQNSTETTKTMEWNFVSCALYFEHHECLNCIVKHAANFVHYFDFDLLLSQPCTEETNLLSYQSAFKTISPSQWMQNIGKVANKMQMSNTLDNDSYISKSIEYYWSLVKSALSTIYCDAKEDLISQLIDEHTQTENIHKTSGGNSMTNMNQNIIHEASLHDSTNRSQEDMDQMNLKNATNNKESIFHSSSEILNVYHVLISLFYRIDHFHQHDMKSNFQTKDSLDNSIKQDIYFLGTHVISCSKIVQTIDFCSRNVTFTSAIDVFSVVYQLYHQHTTLCKELQMRLNEEVTANHETKWTHRKDFPDEIQTLLVQRDTIESLMHVMCPVSMHLFTLCFAVLNEMENRVVSSENDLNNLSDTIKSSTNDKCSEQATTIDNSLDMDDVSTSSFSVPEQISGSTPTMHQNSFDTPPNLESFQYDLFTTQTKLFNIIKILNQSSSVISQPNQSFSACLMECNNGINCLLDQVPLLVRTMRQQFSQIPKVWSALHQTNRKRQQTFLQFQARVNKMWNHLKEAQAAKEGFETLLETTRTKNIDQIYQQAELEKLEAEFALQKAKLTNTGIGRAMAYVKECKQKCIELEKQQKDLSAKFENAELIRDYYPELMTLAQAHKTIRRSLQERWGFVFSYCKTDLINQNLVFHDVYDIREALHRGPMSEVLLVRDKNDGQNYAVKRVPRGRSLFRELRRLTHLNGYDNIVELKEVVFDGDSACFVMPYYKGGTLAEWINQNISNMVNPLSYDNLSLVQDILYQVLSAIDTCHRYGIVHRDLKPHNFLLETNDTSNLKLRLCDFGLSTAVDLQQKKPSLPAYTTMLMGNTRDAMSFSRDIRNDVAGGTVPYMAPELLDAFKNATTNATSTNSSKWNQLLKGRTAFALDAFAVGVVVYQMLTGKLPERDSDTHNILIDRPDEDILRQTSPEHHFIVSTLWDLVEGLCQFESSKRLSISEAIRMPFFQSCIGTWSNERHHATHDTALNTPRMNNSPIGIAAGARVSMAMYMLQNIRTRKQSNLDKIEKPIRITTSRGLQTQEDTLSNEYILQILTELYQQKNYGTNEIQIELCTSNDNETQLYDWLSILRAVLKDPSNCGLTQQEDITAYKLPHESLSDMVATSFGAFLGKCIMDGMSSGILFAPVFFDFIRLGIHGVTKKLLFEGGVTSVIAQLNTFNPTMAMRCRQLLHRQFGMTGNDFETVDMYIEAAGCENEIRRKALYEYVITGNFTNLNDTSDNKTTGSNNKTTRKLTRNLFLSSKGNTGNEKSQKDIQQQDINITDENKDRLIRAIAYDILFGRRQTTLQMIVKGLTETIPKWNQLIEILSPHEICLFVFGDSSTRIPSNIRQGFFTVAKDEWPTSSDSSMHGYVQVHIIEKWLKEFAENISHLGFHWMYLGGTGTVYHNHSMKETYTSSTYHSSKHMTVIPMSIDSNDVSPIMLDSDTCTMFLTPRISSEHELYKWLIHAFNLSSYEQSMNLNSSDMTKKEHQHILNAMRGEIQPGAWYRCSRCQYPYAIGECGGAMEGSQCPSCGLPIGGEKHRLYDGNEPDSAFDGSNQTLVWNQN